MSSLSVIVFGLIVGAFAVLEERKDFAQVLLVIAILCLIVGVVM